MKKFQILLFILIVCFSFYLVSCKKDTKVQLMNGIKIYPMLDSTVFENASLQLVAPTAEMLKPGKNIFKFKVENFDLKVQTSDAQMKKIANSNMGQHIHFILNDEPYMANYDNEVSVDLKDGHYVVVAFLSRSYHESVKSKGAYVFTQFDVGKTGMNKKIDITKPCLVYSRPKGTYKGEEIKKLLLDFYLLNTTLSPDGNKVRVTINNTPFILTEWAPYLIEGLAKGEVKIKLELIDAENKLIDGPFNSVERTITLL